MLKKLVPNLMVTDVPATIKFYTEILGFALENQHPLDPETPIWANVERDGVSIMFQERNSMIEEFALFTDRPISPTQTLFIEVEGVEKLHEAIKDKVEILSPLQTTFYGTIEFYFKDLNGYVLGFSQIAPPSPDEQTENASAQA